MHPESASETQGPHHETRSGTVPGPRHVPAHLAAEMAFPEGPLEDTKPSDSYIKMPGPYTWDWEAKETNLFL